MIDGESAVDVLLEHAALLVHCAGFAKMVGNATTNNLSYLERLEVAAKGRLELACSTVQLGDGTSLEQLRNFTGPCGLVLRPVGVEAITYCWPSDAGTSIGEGGRRVDVTSAAKALLLSEAISRRSSDKYNEIGVWGYKVVGVFMSELSFEYSIPENQVMARLARLGNPSFDHPDYLKAFKDTVDVHQVCAAFPELDIFHLKHGELHWIRRNGLSASGVVGLDHVYGRSATDRSKLK